MYKYDEIRSVHLEVTDKCNASCPMCPRNDSGGAVNPLLPLVELTLDDVKKMFPPEFIKQLDKMFMCGNYGDPIVAKDTLEIFQYFRQHNRDIILGMNTNGSAKSPSWWFDLAGVLGNRGYVIFSIDGLDDTNAIYRRGTRPEKIFDNAEAFIIGGGEARWDYIVFRHNEHQINDARQIADEIGFAEFRIKKTGRFYSVDDMQVIPTFPVKNRQGEIEYVLEPPENLEWRNDSLTRHEQIIEQFGSMDRYLDETPVSCKVAAEKSLYVSAEGMVVPCCWVGGMFHVPGKRTQLQDYLDSLGGPSTINAKHHAIRDIVEGPFFTGITDSWSKPSVADGKMWICAKTCGSSFDQFKDQYE